MSVTNTKQSAKIIQNKMPNFTPKIGIVSGSGQGKLANQIEQAVTIPYSELPGFPEVSVHGQSGQLILGYLAGTPIAYLQGRAHLYEGTPYDAMKVYVRTLKLIGCEIYLATNAVGSLREEVGPGELVLVTDHINFQPGNPLAGPNDDEFGPRFLDVSTAYNLELREQLQTCARDLQLPLAEGVYISVLGPSFETASEIRAFKTLGADVVGMSTVAEVILAHHCGLKVAVISTVTNLATGLADKDHDHNNVVAVAEGATEKLAKLIKTFAKSFSYGS